MGSYFVSNIAKNVNEVCTTHLVYCRSSVIRGWLCRAAQKKQAAAARIIQKAFRRKFSHPVKTPTQVTSPHSPLFATPTAEDVLRRAALANSLKESGVGAGSDINIYSPGLGAIVAGTCANSAEHVSDASPLYQALKSDEQSEKFYTCRREQRPTKTVTLSDTPTGPKTSSMPRRPPGFMHSRGVTEEQYLVMREKTPEGVTYHVHRSPDCRRFLGSRNASEVFRTVGAAVSAAFLTHRRFNMSGAFSGIPYFEAHDGIVSRRRMPRVS